MSASLRKDMQEIKNDIRTFLRKSRERIVQDNYLSAYEYADKAAFKLRQLIALCHADKAQRDSKQQYHEHRRIPEGDDGAFDAQ